MAFGLPTASSGEFTPILKYNAKAGRMYRVDRSEGPSGWTSEDVDVSDNFSAVFDLENIRVGWQHFGPQGPQRVMGIYQKEPTPARPTDTDEDGKPLYKAGFVLLVALSKDCGGGVREFSSSAGLVVEAVGSLHDAYLGAPEKAQGKLPVVKFDRAIPEKSKHGTNYRPEFSIVGWVDRPASLAGDQTAPAAQQPTQDAASAPPSTGSQQMTPPAQQAAQPAEAASADFG